MNWTLALLLVISFGCLVATLRSPVKKSPLGLLFVVFLSVLMVSTGLKLFVADLPSRVFVYSSVVLTLIPVSALMVLSRSLKAPYLRYPVAMSFLPLLLVPVFAEILRPTTLLSFMMMVLQLLSAGLLGIVVASYYRQFRHPIRLLAGYLFLIAFLYWMWLYHPEGSTSIFTMVSDSDILSEGGQNSAPLERKWVLMYLFGTVSVVLWTSSLFSLHAFLQSKEEA